MKRSKFSDTQIVSILKQAEAGIPVKEVLHIPAQSEQPFRFNVNTDSGRT